MALKAFLILSRPRSGHVEGRNAPIQPVANSSHPRGANPELLDYGLLGKQALALSGIPLLGMRIRYGTALWNV
jgi:hypothetical protein